MPNRILRDWTDSFSIDELDVNAERFFTRLIMKVDDYGRYYADARLLRSSLFPLKSNIRDTDITRWLTACEKSGLIAIYNVACKSYLEIRNFKQQLRQKHKKFPDPEQLEESATHTHSTCTADDSPETETETETEKIDFPSFVSFLNKKTGRKFKNVNEAVRRKYNARLKEGYTKEDIINAIKNAVKTEYHRNNGCQFLTPEFFSRSENLEKYSSKASVKDEPDKQQPKEKLYGPWSV